MFVIATCITVTLPLTLEGARLRQGRVVLAGGSHVAKAGHEIRPLAAALLVDKTLWGTQELLRGAQERSEEPQESPKSLPKPPPESS